jgi:ABC-type dipeptide/oligopeptide/nickel transport system permease subunit
MLSEAQTFIELTPWTVLSPGLALKWLVHKFNLFDDAGSDLLDPRFRGEA